MDAILEQFITEARDNLEYLDKHLEELKDGDEETINAIFRAAHTLKGGAGLVGLNAVKEVTHAAEDLFDAFRNHKIEYSDEMLDILYDAFDEVIEMIDAVEETGEIDIKIDEDVIDKLKNSIRGFLSEEQNEEEEIKTLLNIDNNLQTELFNPLQIQKLSKKLPLYTPVFSKEFQTNDNWYLMDLDLDIDTIKLGNDPVYLFYLLNSDDIEVVVETDCNVIQEDVLNWGSRLVVAVKSNEEQIIDSFFNIIDEIKFKYLSIETLFDNEYENIENELFDEFKNEFIEIIKKKEFSILDEKLTAITQILNPKTKEGFILHRLQTILTNFDINNLEYEKIVDMALKKLNLNLNDEQKEEKEKIEKNEKVDVISEEEQEILKKLLKTQLQILDLAIDDVVVERTKIIVKKILKVLNKETDVSTIDKTKLREIVISLLQELGETELQGNKKEK